MPVFALAGTAALLLLLTVPVFLALIGGTLLSHSVFGPPVPAMVFAQQMVQGVNKFALLAVPLFIYASAIISRGEIGKRLLALVESCVGHITGGMALATVVTCALFGALSGVGQAAIVSLGPLVFPVLLKQGYSRGFAMGLILTASTLAMLIPPSVAMILYALQATSSVESGFLAGLGAGLVLLTCLTVYAVAYARRHRIPGSPRQGWADRLSALRGAGLALGLPLIIFGGIYTGTFTPTEAAAGGCLYAILVEVLIFRSLTLRDLWSLTQETAGTISALLIILAAGAAMSYLLTLQQVPQQVAGLLNDRTRFEILLIVNVTFLLAGMVLDPNSAIIVLTPIVLPAATAAGIDPVHFGAIVVLNIAIGMITPPFGINIFTAMVTFRASYGEIVGALRPFILVALAALVLVTWGEALVMWLPRLLAG